MANFTIRVEGLQEINKILSQLEDKAESVKDVLNESALAVLDKAKSNLAGTPFAESVGGIMQSGFVETSGNGMEVEVGFNKHYSPYIEYGTGSKVDVPAGFENYALQFIGKGIREVNIKPHPYFHPALNDELKTLRRNLRNLLA
ncbi:MAG: HK97 gp10 family phage protein [Flavobacteriales bacterium]|nr:MAG: HK97 gp10 family phage protein [Flavobacteriales bacterium]